VNAAVINYTVTTSASPSNAGTTSPNASFSNGSTVTAQAAVNSGYSFVKWTQNGTTVSTSPSYSFQLNANVRCWRISRRFIRSPGLPSPSSGGSDIRSWQRLFISERPFADRDPGHRLQLRQLDRKRFGVSSTPAYSFTATANRALGANFAATSASGNFLWSLVMAGRRPTTDALWPWTSATAVSC